MRTVASTELLVITPQTTSALWPAALSRDSRSVPIKALFVRLTMTGSQTSGAASILELVAGLAGPVCGTGFERVVAHVIYGQTQARARLRAAAQYSARHPDCCPGHSGPSVRRLSLFGRQLR